MAKIVVFGASGYVGLQLIPKLLDDGHEVIAAVRNIERLPNNIIHHNRIRVIELDLLRKKTLTCLPQTIDCLFYLVHSMHETKNRFHLLEARAIGNLLRALYNRSVGQFIFLSGIMNDHGLSKHLRSRLYLETMIKKSSIPHTILRTAIIVGKGSSPFEIIRSLVETMAFIPLPKAINQHCQPIAIDDVLFYMQEVIGHRDCINQIFDLGGPEVLTYKQMLIGYAQWKKLRRIICIIYGLPLRLSAHFLGYITQQNKHLAYSLAMSMKNRVVCKDERIKKLFSRALTPYSKSLEKILGK